LSSEPCLDRPSGILAYRPALSIVATLEEIEKNKESLSDETFAAAGPRLISSQKVLNTHFRHSGLDPEIED